MINFNIGKSKKTTILFETFHSQKKERKKGIRSNLIELIAADEDEEEAAAEPAEEAGRCEPSPEKLEEPIIEVQNMDDDDEFDSEMPSLKKSKSP